MSGLLSSASITTLERILSIAGPLVVAFIDKGNQPAAQKILDATSSAIDYARLTIKGAEHFAEELRDIADELEGMKERGGASEADFDAVAARIDAKTARLKEIVAARAAAAE
jgi:hypothetical protein